MTRSATSPPRSRDGDVARARMAEMSCPANAGETTTTTAAAP